MWNPSNLLHGWRDKWHPSDNNVTLDDYEEVPTPKQATDILEKQIRDTGKAKRVIRVADTVIGVEHPHMPIGIKTAPLISSIVKPHEVERVAIGNSTVFVVDS